MSTIRVLHAEWSDVMHKRLAYRLKNYPDIDIIGHCDTYADLIIKTERLKPDVVIASSGLWDSVNVIPRLCHFRCSKMLDFKLIVLDTHSNIDYFINAVLGEADAYVLMSNSAKKLYECIIKVCRGEKYLPVPKG